LKNKQTNPGFSKIWLIIPNNFLQQFDKETKNNYSSRNEAIRRGMKLVLRELEGFKSLRESELSNYLVEHNLAIQPVNQQATEGKCC
jgi:metal-responsive CopG/Arc/MetJ family transcriptional regulator